MSSNSLKRKREEDNESVKKLKQLKAKLLPIGNLSTAEVGNTPKDVRKEMGDQWHEMINTGTHVTDPNNPAFKNLFGDDVPVETGGENVSKEKGEENVSKEKGEEGGGKGFWSFLGIGGRKRRRRKKSRKKKKSKKRKSRRRRRGGADMSDHDNWVKQQYINNKVDLKPTMGCPRFSGSITCAAARAQAFSKPGDAGFAWWDYNLNYLEGQIKVGKIGDSMKVCTRVNKWIDEMNKENPTMWADLKWYDDEQETRRQTINQSFSNIGITKAPIPRIVEGQEIPTWWDTTQHNNTGGVRTFVPARLRFIKGGRRRKSRRKKRRKSKKRKSRRRSRRRRR
tara:strand:+ start:1576 stop:2589 length:1014 start_codon:yes stop_codon:yes gene_type:complete